MSVENREKDLNQNISSVESLKSGNINQALVGLQENTEKNIDFKNDLSVIGLKVLSYQSDNTEITQKFCGIFDQYICTNNS